MSLPIFQTSSKDLSLLQTNWASQLNPVVANPIVQGVQVTGITLAANTPLVINHLLSRKMQGWFVVDQNAAASIYRTQPFNSKTITLEANANVVVNIWCY